MSHMVNNKSYISEFMSKSADQLTRTERLKKRLLDTVPEIDSERMRLITEAYQMAEGEEIQIKRAKAFKHITENMTLRILSDELIVGNNGRYIKSGVLFPENNVRWIERDLDLFEIRPQDPYRCTEETKKEIRKHIDYWKKHSKLNMFKSMVPDETYKVFETGIYRDASIDYGLGHTNCSYGKVIKYGFKGVLSEINNELAKINLGRDVDDQERFNFLRAAKITVEAAMNYCKRYAAYAAELAEQEQDPQRKAELKEISQTCTWVSEEPARTFREACQLFYFVHVMLWLEQDGYSYTPGRFDQYMYPCYARDVKDGRITREEAQELVECVFIKLSEITQLIDSDVARFWAGDPTGQDLMLGGVDENGKDATNEMTYICLDAMEHIRLIQPNMSVRYHSATPEKLRLRAAEVIKTGIGMPQNFNDRVCMEALMNSGVSLKDARNFCIIGCVELVVSEDSWANGGAAWVTIPKIFELALNQGKSRFYKNVGEQIGPKTQDPRTFKSYEEVWEAFITQLKYFIYHGAIIMNLSDWIHGELTPQPFLSAMSLNPIKNGRDITRGGTRYNALCPQAVGVVNVGDALAALKKFVFEEKVFTMEQMIDMLDSNFAGKEAERQLLLNRAPKYGNDDDYVDGIVAEICKFWCDEVSSYTIPRRGGKHAPGIYTVISNVPFGATVGALPSGRPAGYPLADGGVSPQIGCDHTGPTGVINSASKIDHSIASNGTLLNQRFNPATLEGDAGTQNLAALIKTYFEKGGFHIQFNVVSSETLRAAQEKPEDYKDLLVRVAGYSAYFTALSPEVQDNIIRRTEQGGF
jgi:pyruvate formate-lyase/glycerol dehydratase family glycyl radical enzyme